MVTPFERAADRMIGGAYYNGWPDRVIPTTPPTAVEIKSGKCQLSDAQKRMRTLLCSAGWRYFVLRVDASEMVRVSEHVGGSDVGVSYASFMRAIGRVPRDGITDTPVRTRRDDGRVWCACGWIGRVENVLTVRTTRRTRTYCRECGMPIDVEGI